MNTDNKLKVKHESYSKKSIERNNIQAILLLNLGILKTGIAFYQQQKDLRNRKMLNNFKLNSVIQVQRLGVQHLSLSTILRQLLSFELGIRRKNFILIICVLLLSLRVLVRTKDRRNYYWQNHQNQLNITIIKQKRSLIIREVILVSRMLMKKFGLMLFLSFL